MRRAPAQSPLPDHRDESDDGHANELRRLCDVSERRFVRPETLLTGRVGDGQVIPDDLLSIAGLDLQLTPEQRRTLAREEAASVAAWGVEFEAVLMAGFALEIHERAATPDWRTRYLLHEIGEEARHSLAFLDLIDQLRPAARNPWLTGLSVRTLHGHRRIIARPAILYTLVLAGEEIPDLVQKLVAEHPDSDPYLAALSRYHRTEEARHRAFARAMLPEVWAAASWFDRWFVRRLAPTVIGSMFDQMIHPGVYDVVGLPGEATWKAVRRSPRRIRMRHQATRPVISALLRAGALVRGRIPRGWQRLCGVDAEGASIDAADL
jgi:hypothetical protein